MGVTTLQMYSILALNCLISAYSLSVLYMEGVKFGDRQMTITGMMIAALFFFVTQSEPQFYLSRQQPHKSVLSGYIIWSLIGQSITHLYTLTCAVTWSKPHTPTDEETRDPEGKLMQISALPSDEFRSNLLILMAADFGIAIGWERFCRYFFRKLPNPLIPVRVPPLDIVKKAKQKQRQKHMERVKKAKESAVSPWKMMRDVQKQTSQAMEQQRQQQMRQ